MNKDFWAFADRLVAVSRVVIERSKGSAHLGDPGIVYPVDYGYLEGTTSTDGAGVDVWVGAAAGPAASQDQPVSAFLLTVDLTKKDAEVKLLIGCSDEETRAIMDLLDSLGSLRCLLVRRPVAP